MSVQIKMKLGDHLYSLRLYLDSQIDVKGSLLRQSVGFKQQTFKLNELNQLVIFLDNKALSSFAGMGRW